MGVSKNDVLAVVLEDGRICKMHLLFPTTAVYPDADEVDDYFDRCSPECDCTPSAEDVAIAIEEGDNEFLRAHGLLYLLGENNGPEVPDDNAVRFGRMFDHEPLLESVFDADGSAYEDVSIPSALLKLHNPWYDHPHLHHKTAYGPSGERILKYVPVESHGVHGRKPRRPEHKTIRHIGGATPKRSAHRHQFIFALSGKKY